MSLDVYLTAVKPTTVYSANITHNLNKMADAAGIYKALWRPEEMEPPATKARDLIPHLQRGLADLVARPDYFAQFNPPNGWGTYAGLVKFVRDYLNACGNEPDAEVRVSR